MTSEIPAAELVAQGLCFPLCLVAGDHDAKGKCACRCRGEFHGALADVPVQSRSTVSARWWKECGHGGWNVDLCPVVRTLKEDCALWRQMHEAREHACYVRAYPRRSGFQAIWDALPGGFSEHEASALWPGREARLLKRLTKNLFAQDRISSTIRHMPPSSNIGIEGIRDIDEARTIALIVGECFMGNPCGVVRAIEVLEGRPDPTTLGLSPEHGYPDWLAYEGNPAERWSKQ